jgi:hypothetical protein
VRRSSLTASCLWRSATNGSSNLKSGCYLGADLIKYVFDVIYRYEHRRKGIRYTYVCKYFFLQLYISDIKCYSF